MEQSEYFEQPYDYNYDHHYVEDFFDFAIHGDVCVNKPEENTRNNQNNKDIY